MPTIKRLSISVHGKVQGVWFRVSAAESAGNLGLTGWVQNAGASEVRCEVQGSPDMLEAFVEWCHEGPPLARVDQVISNDIPVQTEDDFDIRRS